MLHSKAICNYNELTVRIRFVEIIRDIIPSQRPALMHSKKSVLKLSRFVC